MEKTEDASDLAGEASWGRTADLVIVDLEAPGAADAVLALATSARGGTVSLLLIGDRLPGELIGRLVALPRADFLRRPIERTELLLRVRALLRAHEETVHRVRSVPGAAPLTGDQRFELLDRLARAVEYKDDDTGEHPRRVGRIASRTALALGLPDALAELIELAAPLHDVGKIAIPDAILLKPNDLDVWEAELMRSHTVVGRQLLAGSDSPVLQMAEGIAFSHHERWDGRGYPVGLRRGSIPIPARIAAVADAYDAMSFDRPYREALPPELVEAEIRMGAGRQYDPTVVEAFLEEALPRLRREGLRRTA